MSRIRSRIPGVSRPGGDPDEKKFAGSGPSLFFQMPDLSADQIHVFPRRHGIDFNKGNELIGFLELHVHQSVAH